MDFTFTEEQTMTAGAFRQLTEDVCTPADIRAVFEGRDERAGERWRRIADMGLLGVLAPESSGGVGLQDADFVLIAEEAGRAVLPEPLIEQGGITVPLLSELASDRRTSALLPQAASGEARVALAHPQNPFVSSAEEATDWIVCQGEEIHLLERSQISLTPEPSIDAARKLFKLECSTSSGTLVASGKPATRAAARALERGALYTAAQCLGLTERMITIAAEYAKQRVQFGKPIGSYQAIKHQLANVQVKLEFARPVVYAAVTRVADVDARALAAVSHAKLAAGDAADLAARTAIQVHGAMGYSWEVDLHLYMKRAWALTGTWGDRSFHARRLLSLIIDGQRALGPDQTFARLRGNQLP